MTQIRRLPTEEGVALIKEVLATGNPFSLLVSGSSMTPTLRGGRDSVVLVCPDKRPPKKNDIVFFERHGAFVLHRIVKLLPDGAFLINGDGQHWCETIEPQQVFAVASSIVRKKKLISCDSFSYRVWCILWRMTRPVRPYLFWLSGMARRLQFRRKG